MEFIFDLATPADDAAIRRLLANNPVPGQVTVTYEREPDFFLGCGTLGHFCQVLVARHQPSGEVAAVATRTTRPLYINGHVEEVGYLSQLRVDKRFRGRWVVSNGFRFFHQLDADRRVSGYITTIIEGNTEAQGILVHRARRHFPIYREIDRLCTLAIILRSPRFVERLRKCFRSSAWICQSRPPLPDMTIRQELLKHALTSYVVCHLNQ
jgi:hypothetical protein